jgi:hypothetical protein
MSATLYILRQQPEHISPSLFLGSDTQKDIKDIVVVRESSHTLTYDELIEKIFSSAHVIVI